MVNRFLDEVSLTEQSSGSVVNITNQEEIKPPEETSMLLWDPNLSMPLNDVFEAHEPPAEVLAIQTQSRCQSFQNNPTIVQSSRGKQISDHLKAPVVS
jgi:hypothetical protein